MEVDMKIKRYTAGSMRQALAQVRSEQGPDAVILSSRRSGDGIEVIAAIDHDEALFNEASRQRSPAPVISPLPVEQVPAPMPAAAPAAAAPARTTTAAVAPARPVPTV